MITVLLAESDSTLRLMIAELLRFSSYQVIALPNGRDALAYLHLCEGLPEVILSDLLMEPVSGHELLEAVRSNRAWVDIPFLLMAAPAQLVALQIELKHNVEGYLPKPFTLKELLGSIQQALTTSRPHRQAQQLNDDETHPRLA